MIWWWSGHDVSWDAVIYEATTSALSVERPTVYGHMAELRSKSGVGRTNELLRMLVDEEQ